MIVVVVGMEDWVCGGKVFDRKKLVAVEFGN